MVAGEILGMDAEDAKKWTHKQVSGGMLPVRPDGFIFKTHALMWACHAQGHWRGEPDNPSIRKLAKSIAMCRFRPVRTSDPKDFATANP